MNSRLNHILILIVFSMFSMPVLLPAQLSQGGLPCTFSRAIAPDTINFVTVERPPMEVLSAEDQQSPLPYRFAVNVPVNFGIGQSGNWFTAGNGTNVWRLNVKSPGAKALILYFDRYNLPEGGKVFVYNLRRTQLLGAFTSLNNNHLSTFATGLIYGDELTIEYNAPEELTPPDLHISEVGHAYRGISDYTRSTDGFGGSGPCEVNINCTEGNDWQKQKRSVTRIAVKRGAASLWCSGSLVNNVRNDGTPYVLTADHCGTYSSTEDLSKWIFYFNYDGPGCPDPTGEPPLHSVTGASRIAHGGGAGSTGSDFFLVLLQSSIPDSYNVYFNGWSREMVPPSPSGASIHHPQGDIKKISTYTSPLQPAHWVGNPALAHWRVTWSATANGHGTTEGGSSGAPLFNNQGLLVGTLTGGDSSCDSASLNLPDYYGMFSYSWDKNGTDSTEVLKYWLDPDSTNVMVLNGWMLSVQETDQHEWATIYPNPVIDQLIIKTLVHKGECIRIIIHDIWGNKRFMCDWSPGLDQEKLIDMSGFAAGIYLVAISDGDRRIVRKIIKN
jgi:hypothetical protein